MKKVSIVLVVALLISCTFLGLHFRETSTNTITKDVVSSVVGLTSLSSDSVTGVKMASGEGYKKPTQ